MASFVYQFVHLSLSLSLSLPQHSSSNSPLSHLVSSTPSLVALLSLTQVLDTQLQLSSLSLDLLSSLKS
ncbi:hypothetical protein I3843_01G054500 [Carya illinoinensis]|nr:hypothetical protein I3843_01G054500 [Carya illinoinensis]